jgi:8-oxo-dGTP diphosphatase
MLQNRDSTAKSRFFLCVFSTRLKFLPCIMNKQVQEFEKHFLEHGHEIYLRHLSIDCVIFGFHENELKVLLLKLKNKDLWCLPGGFIRKNDSLDDAATRVLNDRTGLSDVFLQQFHAFGEPNRDKTKTGFMSNVKGSWMMDRFVTLGYYALVEYSKVSPQADMFSDDCRWCDIHSIPPLMYDHKQILDKALDVLRLSLNDHPIGYNLLPEKFTMPELQKLYETILDKPIDRRNFQKKILGLDIVVRLNERKTGGAHKAPYLYRFDKRKYDRALREGLGSGF